MPSLVAGCGGAGTYGSIKFLPSWGSNVSISSCSTSPTTLSAHQRTPAIANSRNVYASKPGSAFGLRLNHARGDVSVESQAHAHGHRHSHDHHCVHDHAHGHTNGHSHEHGHGTVQTHAHSPAHASHSHHEDHVHGNGHSCSSHSTNSQCHSNSHDAAAVHAHSHSHSHGQSKGVTTHATTHSHTHEHNHGYDHASGCGGCGHDHSHFPETWVSRTLDCLGLVDLAESMTHSTACTLWAMACYAVSLVLCIPAVTGVLPVPNIVVTSAHTASLAATFAIIGFPQLVESVCLAAAGVVDTHVLMSLAAFGTLYLGMAQEGALLLLLFQLSHILEAKFTAQAQGSLKRLFDTLPDQANAVDLDSSGAPVMSSARSVPARGVPVGTTVLVKPGEEVPLDGVVVWGSANVSQAHISGESEAIKVDPGTQLPAGSRNIDGLLAVKVSSGVDDSTPARIARMAAQAQADKPRLSRLVSTVGEIWSKAVVGVTLVTLVSLVLLGIPLLEKGGALYRAMGVLTAGSPCAVVLVPLAYVCAIATITRRGVLVRSGAALDALLTCKTVALDKTGTITSGALTLTHAHVTTLTPSHTSTSTLAAPALQSLDLESLPSQLPQQPQLSTAQQQLAYGRHAMAVAVALSRASNHPVSKAMVAAGNAGVQEVAVSQFLQVPGMGVQGLCHVSGDDASTALPDNKQGPVMAYFGSLDYIRRVLPEGSGYHEQMDRIIRQKAETSGARAISSLLITPKPSSPSGSLSALSPSQDLRIALFSFDDQVAPGATQAVQALMGGRWRRKGVEHDKKRDRKQVVMLTGDHDRVAAQVARTVGIDTWHANMKPEHKLAYVQEFDAQQTGVSHPAGLVMVGDGINDAPALAAARVGVAVADTPSAMAAAAADFIILNGKGVANLPWLFAIAHKTNVVIKQNLALALTAVVFATLPTVAGFLPLWLAVLIHEGSTLLVAVNSLRLLLDPGEHTLPAVMAAGGQAIRDMFSQRGGHDSDHEHTTGTFEREGMEGEGYLPLHDHEHEHDHHAHDDHGHDHSHEQHHSNGHKVLPDQIETSVRACEEHLHQTGSMRKNGL